MKCNAKTIAECDSTAAMRVHPCEQMAHAISEPGSVVTYWSANREFGLYYVKSNSIQEMRFCPFCGTTLPLSLRDLRYDELQKLGLEPYEAPPEFRDDRWWRDREGI